MAKQRNTEKCKELAQHRPLSKAFSQNDASFCTDPNFTRFFQTQTDPVMEEATALAEANTDSHLLQKIWQKLSTLDKIENKVDTALKRLDRLEQHAQDFSQDLEPSHHKLKEELLLTKEVIQDIIPNLPEFSQGKNVEENREGDQDHFDGTLDEVTLQNLERNKDDFEPELFFMEEEMGDLCTSLHTPDSSPGRRSVDAMYLVDFPNSHDRLDTPSTPFSETYDVVSPVGAPSEFYPNLSEISGSNDYDDFTVRGASIKDASEVGDEEDYEDYYDEDDEDQDSEDDYWRLCPNEQVNQFGMSTIQRTSMGLLEQISRLQEELGVSTIENEDSETTEEEVEEQRIDLMKGEFPIAPGLEDVEVILPDIDAMMQNHMDDDELEMPQSVADASDVADLEDIAIKLRHASLGEEDRDMDYMTIEEFQMISGGLTSKSSNESRTSLPPTQVPLPSIPASPSLLRNSSCQSSDNDSWDNDAEESDENIRQDGEVNGHSFYIHGMTNGSGFDGSFERTLPGPYIGEVALNSLPSDSNTVQGNSGSNIIYGRTVAMMSEDSVPFVTPNDSFDYVHYHGGVVTKSNVDEGKSVSKKKQNGETIVKNVNSDNVMTRNTSDSIKTNGQELDNVEQPRSISDKINCLNAALAQDWGMKTNFKKKSLIKTFRKSLQKKNLTDSDNTDSNDNSNSGESVVADSVLTIFEALKTFEERSHQVQRKKTQLKRKLSSVETHLDRASNVIKSGDVTSTSPSHSCHQGTSIDNKSESETVTSKPLGNLTITQKHFPTGIANDVTQPQLTPEQQSMNQENGMGHHVRSKVNGVCDQEEGKLNGADGADQVPSSPMDEDEMDQHDECYYAVVNRSSEDEVNDVNTDAIQDREYAEPSFPEDPNHGYAEPQTHCPVVKEEPIYSPATDYIVDSHGVIVDEEEKTNPIITVDTIANKTEVVDKSGLADTTSSSSQNRKSDNVYEIITPMQIKPEYAEIKKEVPLDVCENNTKICKSITKEEIPLDSPDLIKTLPDVPLKKSKPLVFQKKEEKMEQKKVELAKKDEVEVVRNLLPSEIKKQQVGPKGLKVNRSNVNKPNTVSPPKPPQNPPQNSVTSSNIEVVHRPPGSRRARIINSYLELERIKREGVNRSDGKPIQISAPNMALMSSRMKGAGGGLRGSDEMLEDMINLQLMQAMGVNPHTIATPPVDTTPKSTPPQRPSHLPIPAPIKTTKPKQPASRPQTSGPSHGIAKMLNRFGESSAPTPKPAVQGFHNSGKTSAAPVSKGLKKPSVRNAFNIEIKDGELEVNIKDDNRQLLMNKLGLHSRGKGLSLPRTSNNSPSYNNNSSNTNSNNSRGLATTQGFESSIKPDGAIILKNHGVREEEEKTSGKPADIRRTDAEAKETPLVADDTRRAKEEEKGKPVTGETSDERTETPSSSSASSSSPQTSLASFKESSGKDEDRVESTSEERVIVSNDNQDGGDVSEEHEIVEASTVPVSPSILLSSSSSSSSSPSSSSSSSSPSSSPPSSPPPPQPSSITASSLASKSSDLPEPRDNRYSVEKESVKPQESSSSDTERDSERVRCETPKKYESGPESIPGPVLESKEDVEMDADDEASKCDIIQTTKQAKPIPAVRKVKPETKTPQTSSLSSSSSSSSSSSASSEASSSGSSSELDEVTGQPKEERKPKGKGLKEVMRRRAQLKTIELAKQSAKEVEEEKKVEFEETSSQEESSSVSKAVTKVTKDETEKVDRTIDGDSKNSHSLVSKTAENLAVESTLEVKDVENVNASRKQDDESAVKEERKERDEEATESSSSQSQLSSISSSTDNEKVKAPREDNAVSNDGDSISKVKDTPRAVSSKISMTLHSPVTSTTTFPISNSTSPSTSTSENISSIIEVTPKMSAKVQSPSPSLSNSSGSQLQYDSSSASEDTHDGAVLSINKTNSREHSPIRSSPGTSTTPSIPRNFGHPFRFNKTRDDNAIPTPKKTTTSVRRSESAVSSLQAKRNKFLNNRPRPDDDDDTSPTSSTPARSFKNVVSGSKFAALREKFSASNDNSNNNAGQGKYGGYSPSPPSTPKSIWQQKSPSSSSRFGGSISEESSPNTSSEQKKSIYGTPPSSPPTPLPYMTPPESPLDFKGKTSTPLATSTPTGAAELKSPTAAELKRQFLFGRDDSKYGDVFTDEKEAKDENSNLKDSMAPIEQIDDEAALEKMLEEATEFDERKKIRSRLREVRKKKRDEREQKALEQERAFEEKMHKLEVESAQQRMRAVGLNVPKTPGDRTKTVTETKDDGKTKTVVETTMRDSGSSKSVQMTIMSKTEDEGFKSQTLQQESKSISVGPGGSSSVTMSKSVSSSSSSTTSTDKPKGRPKTKFEEDMEVKKREREEKRKQDEARFKEQQMQRKKEAYELKKKQAEDAKNRKAALFNKFGGAGGGAKPAGGGGTTMKVQNATTIKQKLLEWAQRVTRGYAGVNVTNFSSSWADGLAFCAVIHHYYPDSFDFNILDPKQRRKNFDLAFNTAEEQADIMPLLDTDDMIMMKNNPDWKCVFTYVQSLYRHLNK